MSATPLLTGVRVVDLTDDEGAYATRLLAELGAEVVRIEPAGGGRGRLRAPVTAAGTSLHHVHRNMGKVVVRGLDQSNIDGLLAGADIAVVQDGAADLVERHPHLVAVELSAFGRRGPAASWRSTELVAQALAGIMHRSGVPELPPLAAPGSFAEDLGAVMGALGALIALWRVRRGGAGCVVDVSSVLALAQCADGAIPIWSMLHMEQRRSGAGMYPLFECTDGLARIVLPMSPPEWRSLIVWLGSPPDWTGPEWELPMLAPRERDLIMAKLPERFAAGTRAEVAADGDRAGVRITPVLTPAEVLANEHCVARETFTEEDIDGRAGRVPGSVFAIDGRRCALRAARLADSAPTWSARPHRSAHAGSDALPLAGIRVLEIGTGVAAPEAGRMLGEWGADVIRVESRRRPDFYRMVMGGVISPPFASTNRNKRTFGADLANPEALDLVRRLIPHVDVVIENNATGVLDRLGLGYAEVSAINPRIVMVSSQLYGDRGPWAAKKGYGPSARSIGGLTWLWAHAPDAPRGVQTIHPDHLGGRLVAIGALAALLGRDTTGVGCHVDVAQFEAVIALLGDIFAMESLDAGAAQPVGNRSDEHAPWGVFRATDDEQGTERWLAICVPDDATWATLAAFDERRFGGEAWRTEAGRLADAAAVADAVAAWVAGADAAELEIALQSAGVPAGQVAFPRIQAEHPVFDGFFMPVDQPGRGSLVLEGSAIHAPALGVARCNPAPLLGEGTVGICRDLLGLDDAEIARLIDAGALDAAEL